MGRYLGHAKYKLSYVARENTVNAALPHAVVRLSSGGMLHLQVYSDLSDVLDEVIQLRNGPHSTLFNSPAWLENKIITCAEQETPCIIAARDQSGSIALVWPMSISRNFGTSVLGWLGQQIFAFNLGICRSDIAAQLSRPDIEQIFTALRASGLSFDAVHLLNQPETWNGVGNPMLTLGQQSAPNANYERKLNSDYLTLYEQIFTARERRNHARQRRRLAEHGEITVVSATQNTECQEILETFFTLKSDQLKTIGASNPFSSEKVKTFYSSALAAAALHNARPLYYGLRVDGKLVATLIGVVEGKRFTTLMSAITLDDVAKTSPGQHLLEELVEHLCEQGIEQFDFGPGPSPQKLRWEMQPRPLYNSYLALTPHAHVVTWIASARNHLLQKLKNNDRAFRFLTKIRARLIGK